jgi:mRNA-degrading endonuclease toxin of MazEF toxin-antitoxin module
MIRRGEVYRVQMDTDSQEEVLVLVVSNSASNRSSLPTVTVLSVLPRRGEEMPGLEVAFELEGRGVKVQPHSLTARSKEDPAETPVGTLEDSALRRIDTILSRHLALSPAVGVPNMMTKKERGGTL